MARVGESGDQGQELNGKLPLRMHRPSRNEGKADSRLLNFRRVRHCFLDELAADVAHHDFCGQ